jgi:hypothetical protein
MQTKEAATVMIFERNTNESLKKENSKERYFTVTYDS